MEIENIKLIVTTLTIFIAMIALVKGVFEYTKNNQLARANVFLELRKRFKETSNFSRIIEYLDSHDSKLAQVSKSDKLKFLGFFDDLAILINSGLVDKIIANQTFGFYVQKAWENPDMWWEDNTKESEYRMLLLWLYNEFKYIQKHDKRKKISSYKF